MDVEPMRCDACGDPIDAAFYVVDGQTWCARCERRVGPAPTAAWVGTLGGLAGGVVASGVALTIVGLLPWDSAPIHILNGTAIPVGLLVGGAVRLGRRDYRSPVLPLAAAALTFLVVAVCFAYGIGNLSDDDGGYISMTELLTRLVDAPDLGFVALLVLPIVLGLESVVGALSLGLGLSAAYAVARGVPVAVDGPFETTAAAPRPAHAI